MIQDGLNNLYQWAAGTTAHAAVQAGHAASKGDVNWLVIAFIAFVVIFLFLPMCKGIKRGSRW